MSGKIRITIEIEDEAVSSTTVERTLGEQAQVPPELARAAAAVGAMGAGPAPAQPHAAVQLGEPPPAAPETADFDLPPEQGPSSGS
jgi:hypothetical protein